MTTVYTFPPDLLHAAQIEFTLASLTASSPKSAFNSLSSVSGPITEYWRVSMTISPLEEADWRALRALMFQLRGGKNLLRIYDPSAAALLGTGGASPTINVAANGSAGDETISLKNLTASQTVALAAGDYLGIGENLHMVVSDAASDGSGNATANILPALRQGVAVDDPVNTAAPTGLFRPLQVPSIVIVPGKINQPVQIDFMEDPDLG